MCALRIVCLSSFALAVAAVALPAPASAAGEPTKWTCTAPGLKSASYDGGGVAYVHLQAFSKGGRYPVTRKGNVATGQTANGTTFTCTGQ